MYVLEALGERPTRDTLRAGKKSLQLLIKVSAPGASEELAVLDTLIRTLYPRKGAVRRGSTKGKRDKGPRAGTLISDADCMGACGRCAGTGNLLVWFQRATHNYWHPNLREMLRVAPSPNILTFERLFESCDDCEGTGRAPVALAEHPFPSDMYPALPPAKQWHLRGDFAVQHGCSNPDVGAVQPHTRGYLVGRCLNDTRDQARRWCGVEAWRPSAGAEDLSAQSEAMAIHANRNANRGDLIEQLDELGVDVPVSLVGRGKKLMESRDRSNLTPNQERRAGSERRMRQNQREWDKAHGLAPTRSKRQNPDDAMLRQAELLGLDIEAIKAALADAAPAPVEYDDSPTAEARRRGDLGPGDVPTLDRESGTRERLLVEFAVESVPGGVKRGDVVLWKTVAVNVETGKADCPSDQNDIDWHDQRVADGVVSAYPVG